MATTVAPAFQPDENLFAGSHREQRRSGVRVANFATVSHSTAFQTERRVLSDALLSTASQSIPATKKGMRMSMSRVTAHLIVVSRNNAATCCGNRPYAVGCSDWLTQEFLMSQITRRIYRIDDATLVKLFSDLAELFPDINTASRFVMLRGVASFDLEEASRLERLSGGYAVNDATFRADVNSDNQVDVTFRRSIKLPNNHLEPSTRFDEFEISFGGRNQEFWKENKKLVADVIELVASMDTAPPSAGNADDENVLEELLRGISATHRQMLGSLEKSLQANISRRAELEKEAEEKEEARRVDHEKSLQALADDRDHLQLQSYRSERRKIMQGLTNAEVLNQRRNLAPTGLTRARWAVFWAAILLGLVSFFISYQSLAQLGAGERTTQSIVDALPENADASLVAGTVKEALGTTNWYLIIRSIFSSLVGIGALAYAASWLRTFYDGEVAASRAIDQYNYDLIRASWIIETVLEVREEHDSVVPDRWIEGVTRGLFADSGSQTTTDESVQALKALLGFTASASFGPEGPKVELNQKGAKKLSNG